MFSWQILCTCNIDFRGKKFNDPETFDLELQMVLTSYRNYQILVGIKTLLFGRLENLSYMVKLFFYHLVKIT